MVRALLLIAAVGCHYHRDANAPGVIDPKVPPAELGSPVPEYPGDPGERMIMLTYGALGGAGATTGRDGGFVDLSPEVTLSWGESPTTHNDRASRLFIPRGVVVPPRSYGVTLGWSALRFIKDMDARMQTTVGPIYVEAQRSWMFAGLGGGVAIDPRTGATGPQVQGFYAIYFVRMRYLVTDGFEFLGGLQFKIPTTWVTRR